MSKQPKSHLKRLTTFDYINSAILLLVAVCCVYPFLYVFFVATTWLPRMAPIWRAAK